MVLKHARAAVLSSIRFPLALIATANQVVYDYADLREVAASLESRGEPTVVYSYGLAFFRSGAA